MPLPGRIFAGDEELGKKDDDHKSRDGGASSLSWLAWRPPIRMRRRRILIAIVASLAIYLFVRYGPADLGSFSKRTEPRLTSAPLRGGPPFPKPTPPGGRPPRDDAQQIELEKHYFNVPIRFYNLATSLYLIADTWGHRLENKNVLFAASSLKSASVMIPLACEMARWERNYVHFVLMGREDLSIEGIKEVNGVTDGCDIYWHGTAEYSHNLP